MNTQTLSGKQYAEWLLAEHNRLMAVTDRLLALDDTEFETFAAAELNDLQDGMEQAEREPLA